MMFFAEIYFMSEHMIGNGDAKGIVIFFTVINQIVVAVHPVIKLDCRQMHFIYKLYVFVRRLLCPEVRQETIPHNPLCFPSHVEGSMRHSLSVFKQVYSVHSPREFFQYNNLFSLCFHIFFLYVSVNTAHPDLQ